MAGLSTHAHTSLLLASPPSSSQQHDGAAWWLPQLLLQGGHAPQASVQEQQQQECRSPGERRAVSHVHVCAASAPAVFFQRSLPCCVACSLTDGQAPLPTALLYDYAQSREELLVEVALPPHIVPPHIGQQQVAVAVQPHHLCVSVGQQRVIDAPLAGRVSPQHSSWRIEGRGSGRKLSITLAKVPSGPAAAAKGSSSSNSSLRLTYDLWSSLLAQPSDATRSSSSSPAGGHHHHQQQSPPDARVARRDQASRGQDEGLEDDNNKAAAVCGAGG